MCIRDRDWLFLKRIVRFGDTDAAGVIHFHHLFRWCHESWEESLEKYGLRAVDVFPSSLEMSAYLPIALPIVHCEANFFSPITIGEELIIELSPIRVDIACFQIQYKFQRSLNEVAVALTRHRAINAKTRKSCDLPEGIDRWLEASSLNGAISSL